jgi:diguanylate cyclase (GGDEF)-like protein
MIGIDTDLRSRQLDILRGLSARESPRVLFLFVVVVAAFDVGYAIIGIVPPPVYYATDVVQGGYMLLVGIVIARRMLPDRWAPTLFVSAIVVNNLALNVQYTLVGYSAVGVILLLLAAYGAVTLMWRPFLISAVIMAAVTTYTLLRNDPDNGAGWALTAYTALAVSATILYGRGRAVLALAIANRTIEEMATRDALTGLLNRHGLAEASGLLVGMAERTGTPMFAIFVDIAGLKRVNDGFGHVAGDTVILRTAATLRTECREADLLARWGGDEFVVLGLGEPPEVQEFAVRVAAAIDATGLDGIWTPGVHAGAARGSGESVETLIIRADTAMYDARRDVEGPAG